MNAMPVLLLTMMLCAAASSTRIVVTFYLWDHAAKSAGLFNVEQGSIVKQYGRRLVLNVTRGDEQALNAIYEELGGSSVVESVELDSIVSLTTVVSSESASNNSDASNSSSSIWFQWNLADSEPYSIKAEGVWALTNSTPDVVVAILDSGMARAAESAFLHLKPGYDFVSDPFLSLDGDGRDANATDAGDAGPDCPLPSWHGTKVASILGAGHDASMGLGMKGVAQNATIMPVRVLGLCSSGFANDVSDAIVYSAGGIINGLGLNPTPAKVISMSFTGRGVCPSYLQSAINQAIDLGSIIVAAAGNDGLPDIRDIFPANCKGVISVGARTREGALAVYSNDGADIVAPGGDAYNPVDVLTCGDGGLTLMRSHGIGTSMAVPHVVGAVAIVASRHPDISTSTFWGQVFDIVDTLNRSSCHQPDGDNSSGCYSGGVQLNMVDVVRMALVCTECQTGISYESSSCTATVDRVCTPCDPCPSGYSRVSCSGQSPGVCRAGYHAFALIADQVNNAVRKIDLVTNDVTTFRPTMNAYVSSVTTSCDGSYALYTCGHALFRLNMTSGVSTVIAGDVVTSGATDGVGAGALFNTPNRVIFSKDCSYLLIADYVNRVVRRMNMSTLEVKRFAGTFGSSGTAEGAALTAARFSYVSGFAFSPDESYVLVVDVNKIRKITLSTMMVSTVAGGNSCGDMDGAGSSALFCSTRDMDISPDGLYAYVNDRDNWKIRKINLLDRTVSTILTFDTFISTGLLPKSVRVINPGEIVVTTTARVDTSKYNMILRITLSPVSVNVIAGGNLGFTDGIGTSAQFSNPNGVCVGNCGNGFYFADNVCSPCTVTDCPAGQYVLAQCTKFSDQVCTSCPICPFGMYNSGCGGAANGTCVACASCPLGYGRMDCIGQNAGTCVPGSNNFALVIDTWNLLIRRIDLLTGNVSTAGSTPNSQVWNVATSCDGTFAVYSYINTNVVMKLILRTGVSSVIAGSSGLTGSADGYGTNARFNFPTAVTFSSNCSYIFVTDTDNAKIRKILLSNAYVTTIAGTGITGMVDGLAIASTFTYPIGIVISPDDSFLVVNDGPSVRKITLTGTMRTSTLAGNASITGYADGYGSQAKFYYLDGIDISSDGKIVFVSDTYNNAIRKINLTTNEVSSMGKLPTSDIVFNAFNLVGMAILPSNAYAMVSIDNLVGLFYVESGRYNLIAGSDVAGFQDGMGASATFNVVGGVSVWKCRMSGYYAAFGVCGKCSSACVNGTTIETTACTYTTNRVCTNCSTCLDGSTYRSRICNATTDTVCSKCTVCPNGTTIIKACNALNDTVCSSCGSCANNGYYLQGCGLSAVCIKRTVCPAGMYKSESTAISDGSCLAYTACPPGKYNNGTATSDGSCVTCAACNSGYYTSGCIGTSKGTCVACTQCPSGSVQLPACGGQSPGTCRGRIFNAFSLIADSNNNAIRKLDMYTKNVTTVGSAESLPIYGVTMSCDGAYAVYTCGHALMKLNLTTGVSSVLAGSKMNSGSTEGVGSNARFNQPGRLRMSRDCSYMLVAEISNRVVRKVVMSTLSVSRVAGMFGVSGNTGGSALYSKFTYPSGLAFSPDESYVLVTDYNRVRKLTLAAGNMKVWSVAGSIYSYGGYRDEIGDNARFLSLRDIDISPDGLYAFVPDRDNHVVRKIDLTTNAVTTLVSIASAFGGAPVLIKSISVFSTNEALVSITGPVSSVSLYNDVLRISMSALSVTIVAGGNAGRADGNGTNARFNNPNGLFVWNCGAGFFMSGNMCIQCGACSPGYYPANPCTVYSDTGCSPCSACPSGQYKVGCSSGLSNGICVSCAACAPGYFRANCSGSSAGACTLGTSEVAVLVDANNRAIRRIDIATSNVTTVASIGSECSPAGLDSIALSCDSSFAVYMCNYALMILNLTTGISRVLAGDKYISGVVNGNGASARLNLGRDVKFSKDCTYVLVSSAWEIRKVIVGTAQVSTAAGDSTSGYLDGPALTSKFDSVMGLAISADGNYALIIDRYYLRKLTLTGTMTTSTIAGGSSFGIVDGVGTNARFFAPIKLEISSSGLFSLITDFGCIRKLNITTGEVSTLVSNIAWGVSYGISLISNDAYAIFGSASMIWRVSIIASPGDVTLVAGNESAGYLDGVGALARFNQASSISVQYQCSSGYYRSGNSPCLPCNSSCVSGTTFEASACSPTTNRICSACTACVVGTSYETSTCNSTANRICSASTNECPTGYYKNGAGCVACDGCPYGYGRSNCSGKSAGMCILGSNAFALVAENGGKYIRKVNLVTANATTVGQQATYPIYSVAVSCDGTYAIYTNNHSLMKLDLASGTASIFAGSPATSGTTDAVGASARFNAPIRLRMSSDCSYILVSETGNKVVRMVFLGNASVTRVAGTFATAGRADGAALVSTFSNPYGIAIHPDGSYMLVLDDNKIRKVTLLTTSTVAGDNSSVAGTAGTADGVGMTARFNAPREIEISPGGKYALIADSGNNMMRKFDLITYAVSTFVSLGNSYGSSISPVGLSFTALDTKILFTSISTGFHKVVSMSTINGEMTLLAGSGSALTTNGVGTAAQFNSPTGISVWKCKYDDVWSNDVCHSPCPTPCPSGQYVDLLCACNPCSSCPAGQIEDQACTATSDTVCRQCAACADGEYPKRACGKEFGDTVCAVCDVCPENSYQTQGCNATANTVCRSCSVCPDGVMYQTGACGAYSDTVCALCSACPNGTFRADGCNGNGDSVCAECSVCSTDGGGEFQVRECSAREDTVCSECDSCYDGKYEVQACNSTSDVQCAPCEPCAENGYLKQGCGGNSSGTCVACAQCVDGVSYNQGCDGATSLGSCSLCEPCADDGYYRLGCGGTSAGSCVPCESCLENSGMYRKGCNGTNPGTCVPCKSCSQYGYFNQGCSGTNEGICVSCVFCNISGYFNQGCDGISLGSCVPCEGCPYSGYYYRQGCGGANAGTCVECGQCPQNGYYRRGCNGTSPGECVRCVNV